ncbi:restriction endonuclease subunit S [Henriciella marina]|uniref:restriction endonuclease subunit S n=1 Tax=Henriciella marina TaxID=453851 RepID=UPI000369C8A9|nr:restriction endonuclease subunit S [Henriciella marina]
MRYEKLKRLTDQLRPITYGIVQAGPHYEGGIPYIRPADMADETGVVDEANLKLTSPEIAASYRRSSVTKGDIVISIGPSFGKVMLVPESLEGANLTQGTARVACSAKAFPRYIFWCLRSEFCRSQWEASVGGATFRALNLGPLAETNIPSHSLEQQKVIASFLDKEISKIDLLIERVGGRAAAKVARQGSFMALLMEKRDSLINAAILGELDLSASTSSEEIAQPISRSRGSA